MNEGETIEQDDATRAAEEEQTAALLEIDEENWRRSGLRFEGSGPDRVSRDVKGNRQRITDCSSQVAHDLMNVD